MKINYRSLSIIFFALALMLSASLFISFGPGLYYIMALFAINLGAWVFILKDSHDVLKEMLLRPILLFTFNTFILTQGIANYYQYVEDSWYPLVTTDVLRKTAGLVIVGNLAVWLGYLAFVPAKNWGKKAAGMVRRWVSMEFTYSETRIWLLFWGSILTRTYLVSMGGRGYFSSATIRTALLPIVQYSNLIEELAPLCLCLYFALVLKRRGGSWLGFMIMFALEIATIFLAGFKAPVVYRFVYLGIVYAFLTQRFPQLLVLLGVMVLLIVYPVNMSLRAAFVSGSFQAGDISAVFSGAANTTSQVIGTGQAEQFTLSETPERVLRTRGQMEQFAMAVQYTDRTGGLRGQDLLYFVYSFIPRIIWPSKPIIGDRGSWFHRVVYGYTYDNAQAITVPGTLYLNFGWPGIVLGFLVLGGFLRFGDELLAEIRGSIRVAALVPFLIFALALPNSMIFLHFAGVMRQIGFLTIVLAFFLVPTRQVKRSLVRQHQAHNLLSISQKI